MLILIGQEMRQTDEVLLDIYLKVVKFHGAQLSKNLFQFHPPKQSTRPPYMKVLDRPYGSSLY